MTSEGIVQREEILHLLGPVKRQGDWLLAFCPAHDDGAKHSGKDGQSLGLSSQGVLRCFAGCEFGTVMEALRGRSNIPSIEIHRSERQGHGRDTMVALYKYRNAANELVGEKGRFESVGGQKSFRWRAPGVADWPGDSGLKMSDLPLYGSEKLADQPEGAVFFVEGEKACEACWNHGLLAVTGPGGAGQKDFGKALDVLRGRQVMLWPDNDAPGRQLMLLIEARLAGIAKTTRPVFAPVPEKGDAFDYFAAGHTAEEIEEQSPSQPIVHVLDVDAVRVTVPTLVAPVTFQFFEMEKSTRSLDAEVVVSTFGSSERPYTQRINLLSSSARSELRTDLNAIYGKEFEWSKVLNTALAMARETYLNIDQSSDVSDIPDSMGELLLIPPFVVSDGVTILFGDGSSLKSYLAFAMSLCMGVGAPFCHFPTPHLPTLVIDYEDSRSNFRRRITRLTRGLLDEYMEMPPPFALHYWDARGIPLADQVEALTRKIEKAGIGHIIIDSAAPACGGDPLDAKAVLGLFRAVRKLNRPTTILAHITKTGDNQKPYGNVFWHNEARRTWFVHRVQEEDSDDLDIGLYCRKVNDGPKPSPLAFHVHFDGTEGPVYFRRTDIAATAELREKTSPRNQVWSVLERALTISEIVETTGLAYDAVEAALRHGPFEPGETVSTGTRGKPAKRWARRVKTEYSEYSANIPQASGEREFPL